MFIARMLVTATAAAFLLCLAADGVRLNAGSQAIGGRCSRASQMAEPNPGEQDQEKTNRTAEDQAAAAAPNADSEIPAPPVFEIENSALAPVVTVYRDALRNLLEINTVWYEGDSVIRAGAGYANPWTRDGSLNALMAGSLLEPAIAENTLWHITAQRQTVSGQWWDRMIWVIAAWDHYLITGDREFLRQAYGCAAASLVQHRRDYFVEAYGLFRGPSHLCDGIAGYPDPPAVKTEGQSSYCEDYPHLVEIMPTSLQAIYYGAYRAAAAMARALQREEPEVARWEHDAEQLRAQATRHLWIPELHRYGYFVHGQGPKAGQLETHQEGAGLAFALLFGLADDDQSREIMNHFHNQPYGMTCVWPHFARFSDERPGRHNVLVWPQMNAYWALATLRRGRPDLFDWELDNVTRLLHRTSPDIREIYDSLHGTPNGGIQNGRPWEATHDQTWGATGYLGMIYRGVFGLQFEEEGLRFAPNLPPQWGRCALRGLIYRDAELSITLTGSGSRVTRFELDGEVQREAVLPATAAGKHTILVHVESSKE